MYDMSTLKTRYFELKLKNSNNIIHIEPPRIKTLKKIMHLAKNENNEINPEDFDTLIEAASMAFSKNKESRNISIDYIDDNWNIDELQALMDEYFLWISKTSSEKN